MNCSKCGKEIKGVQLYYPIAKGWECSDCDKYDVIRSETGTKLIYAFSENGYAGDIEMGKKYLHYGVEYTVDHIEVGSWHTDVILMEVPNIKFNSCLFARSGDNDL